MSDELSFDDLVTTPKNSQYPLAPQGLMAGATCTKIQAQVSTYPNAGPDDKVVSLWWELEKSYTGDDGQERKHKVFSKRYSLFFGPKAGLNQLCIDLTGKSLIEAGVATKTPDGRISWKNLPAFEGMMADLVIKHVPGKDRTFANIASYLTSAEQKKYNQNFLPKA